MTSYLTITSSQGGTFAVLFALEKDLSHFEHIEGPSVRTFKKGTTSIREYLINGHRILVTKMGAGCVETAVNATSLLSCASCETLLSVGPVGALSEQHKIGDWILVKEVVPWQSGTQLSTGFKISTSWTNEVRLTSSIPILEHARVTSGESFICSSSFIPKLKSESQSSLVDMNLFGLVKASRNFNLPQLHLRVVSDRSDDKALADFTAFEQNYVGEGAQKISQWLNQIPIDTTSPKAHPNLKNLLETEVGSEQNPPK